MPQAIAFYVNDKPHCFWDIDIQSRNREFINSIDSEYFTYVASTHYDALDDESTRQKAALAIAANYQHALETLFALIGSALQCPHYTIGWFHRYTNQDIREIALNISTQQNKINNIWGIDWPNWDIIASLLFQADMPLDKLEARRAGFGRAWRRFASDFYADECVAEYNSIKHGLRARMGGFSMSYGIEDVPGIPAKPENMRTLGGSIFGSSYHTVEEINRNKRNLRIRSHSRNWSPTHLVQRTFLASLSISNVISFLKIQFSDPSNKSVWQNPVDLDDFDTPWNENITLRSSSFDYDIEMTNSELLSTEKIKELIDNYQLKCQFTRDHMHEKD